MGKEDREGDEGRTWVRSLGILLVVVWELLITTGIGVAIGYFAWNRWGAPWWVLLLSSLAGLSLGFYRLYLTSKKDW